MFNLSKLLCGALAVVLITSSAFAAEPTLSYLPKLENGKYVFTSKHSNVIWEQQKASLGQTKQAVDDFMKSLEQEQAQAKKRGKVAGAAVHTIKAFPAESLYFFIGMGAVAFSQLVFDNAQNPVGLEQHIEHSLSPMGMAGFAVFMYFNNLTSSTLQTFIKNPSFAKYLPYLGMTAGFGMQSIFSHVMSDPNIKFCAFRKPVTEKDMNEGVDANPCAKAMENFDDLRLAPSLTSMLLSTMMAGKGQQGLKALAMQAKNPILKLTGFDVAMIFAPGGMQIKGIRAVLVNGVGKVTQITAFVAIDAWLNRIVTYGWKNAFDGADFYDINNSIVERVNYLKSNNWKEYETEPLFPGLLPSSVSDWMTKDRSLEDRLKYFQKRMTDWRMTNLADVYEAHQNWSTALGQLVGNYKSSYEFYQNLTDRIRTSRYNTSAMKPLEIAYPLSGVKAYNLAPDKYDGMMTHVKLFENYQRENVAMVAKILAPQVMVMDFSKLDVELTEEGQEIAKQNPALTYAIFKSGIAEQDVESFVKIQGLLSKLEPADKKKIETFRQMLTSKDDKVLAKALYNLRKEQNPALRDPDKAFSKMILALIEILGAPSPQMEPGRGYLLAYQYAPSSQEFINGINFNHGDSIFGTRLITDYYLMQMVCGPDIRLGEKMVKDNLGYPSEFHPPMLRPAKHKFENECIGGKAFMDPNTIYTYKFEQEGKKYRGFLNYIRDTVGASIIGQKEQSNFKNWWTGTTTPQVKAAFDEYALRYEEIVVKMIRGLYYEREKNLTSFVYDSLGLNQKGRNSLNMGPLFNGTIKSIFQEERMYLAVLEEVMNPGRIFDFRLEYVGTTLNPDSKIPALLEIDREIRTLANMLKKIRIVEVQGRERIESQLTNAELTSQVEKVEAAVTTVRQALGVDVPGIGIEGSPLALSVNQKKAAKVALESLSKIAAELANYGNIAHAVSWNKIHDEDSLTTKQPQVDEHMKKALRNSGAATNPAGR